MKLICIIGVSVQKTLLPLLQFRDLYSSVLFLVPKGEEETAEYICRFLSDLNDPEKPKWVSEIQMISIPEKPDYDEIHEFISSVLWNSFAENDPAVINISGGNAEMILASVQAARAMKVPVMYVNSAKLNIQTIEWEEDGIHSNIRQVFADFTGMNVREMLALCNFYPAYLNTDESLPGIQYERSIFKVFEEARQEGLFDSVDRNLILTWNRNARHKNEIDIVFLRKRIFGFVSIKSGKAIRNEAVFQKASGEVKDIYPQWLLKLPCLRVLISKYPVSIGRKKQLLDKSVVVFDSLHNDDDIRAAINMIVTAVDRIVESRQQPGWGFYEQFPEYSDARNDL